MRKILSAAPPQSAPQAQRHRRRTQRRRTANTGQRRRLVACARRLGIVVIVVDVDVAAAASAARAEHLEQQRVSSAVRHIEPSAAAAVRHPARNVVQTNATSAVRYRLIDPRSFFFSFILLSVISWPT